MALCHRQCPNCVNLVTVLVDAAEHAAATGSHIVDIHHSAITEIYDKIVMELGDVSDVAVILRIDGVDVAAKCSRRNHADDDDDECLLF
jgi:hypothetical protein